MIVLQRYHQLPTKICPYNRVQKQYKPSCLHTFPARLCRDIRPPHRTALVANHRGNLRLGITQKALSALPSVLPQSFALRRANRAVRAYGTATLEGGNLAFRGMAIRPFYRPYSCPLYGCALRPFEIVADRKNSQKKFPHPLTTLCFFSTIYVEFIAWRLLWDTRRENGANRCASN